METAHYNQRLATMSRGNTSVTSEFSSRRGHLVNPALQFSPSLNYLSIIIIMKGAEARAALHTAQLLITRSKALPSHLY